MIYYETSNLQMQKKKKMLETLLTISLNGKWDLHKCDASSGLSDLFPISPRSSLGIIILFSCESVFCKDEAEHSSLPN